MPLTKQNAVIPFVGGIQTKQNEYLVQPPNMLELDNGTFRKEGEIAKRYGFTALPVKAFDGSTLIGKKLLTFNNDLLQMTQTNLYSYAEKSQKWFDKGAFASISVDKTNVVRNRNNQVAQSIATNNGITVVTWKDDRANQSLKYTIMDEESGNIIKADAVLSTTGSFVICSKYLTTYIVIFFEEGGILKTKAIDVASLQEFDQSFPAVELSGTAASLINYKDSIVFAANNASPTLEIHRFLPDLSQADFTLYKAPQGGTLSPSGNATSCHLLPDESRNIIYLTYSVGNDVRLQGLYQTLTPAPSNNILIVNEPSPVPRVSSALTSNTQSSEVAVFWEVSDAAPQHHLIQKITYTFDGVNTPVESSPLAVFKRSVGLAAHAFSENGTIYVVAGHESPLQSSIFLLQDTAGSPVSARVLSSVSGGHPITGLLPQAQVYDNEKVLALLEITNLKTETGTITDNTGVVKIRFNFNNPPFIGAQLGQNLLIAGGFVSAYDGSQVVEHGFHLYPENVEFTHLNAGGTVDAGTYSVRVIYEWSDAKGQIHRSAPSISQLQELNGSTNLLQVTVPTLRLTAKKDVNIVFYVSEPNGTILYRAGSIENDPEVDSITVEIDDLVGISSQEILYTTGGVVENIAAPAATIIHRHQNRIFIAGLEEENEIRYSQESVQNEGLGFSDFYRIRVNPAGGPITALGTLDDKLVIFKSDSVYVLSGQGPNFAGQNNDYQQPELVASDIGCNNPSSIVVTPEGLMFASSKGIRLLNRGAAVEDVGAPVEAFERNTVTSAVLVLDNDEIRFTTREDRALIYNYAFKLWSTFTNYKANSAVLLGTTYYHLDIDGQVNKEVIGSYTDNNRPIPLRIKTSWIAPAGLQGWQRVYRLLFLGKKLSEHAFRVNIRYDYDELVRETVYFNTLNEMEQDTIPTPEQFIGTTEGFVSSDKTEVMQFEILPKIQRCEAIQLEVEDIPLRGQNGAAYTMSGLTALVGIKEGTPNMTSSIGSKK